MMVSSCVSAGLFKNKDLNNRFLSFCLQFEFWKYEINLFINYTIAKFISPFAISTIMLSLTDIINI